MRAYFNGVCGVRPLQRMTFLRQTKSQSLKVADFPLPLFLMACLKVSPNLPAGYVVLVHPFSPKRDATMPENFLSVYSR